MSKLSGAMIHQEHKLGNIIIDPYERDNLCPNSYDLRIGKQLKVYKKTLDYHGGISPLDVKKDNPTEDHHISSNGYVLYPGKLYLAHTIEKAGSTKFIPCIEGRSSIARLGIQVHLTAGFGDIGFVGQWTLEICVVQHVRIYAGIRICQIYFDTLEKRSGEKEWLYSGKYSNSEGVIASKSFRDI